MLQSLISDRTIEKNLDVRQRALMWACRSVAVALGLGSAWVSRYTMYPDGISYLDVGDAFWRGDWHDAISAYWSPLYPLILGLFMKVVNPSVEWEYPLVHAVNFLLYAVALICFDYFVRTFVRALDRDDDLRSRSEIGLPIWCWLLVSYSAFTISSLALVTVSFVSGDIIVAAVIYLASALILKICRDHGNSRAFALLGCFLGIGYLTKAAMFLMAFPFMAVAVAAQETTAKKVRSACLVLGCFLLVSGPFILILSISKERPTFGDSGKINYLMNVGSTQFFTPHEVDAKHPIHKLRGLPNAFEYAEPIPGTYPLWYDPSYWHEGIHSHFELKRQIRTLLLSLAELGFIFFSPVIGLCMSAGFLFLYLVSPSIRISLDQAFRRWMLWIPAVVGIGIYSLVVVLPRYVAGLVCLLWIVGYSGVRLPNVAASRRLIESTALLVAFVTLLTNIWQIGAERNVAVFARMDVATPTCVEAAKDLVANGVRPADKIAVIAPWLFPSRQGAYIARLIRARIIGEARPDEYWSADQNIREAINSQFRRAGASAILSSGPPSSDAGWKRLGSTDYYVYFLR